jgi:hypothetical protein
LPAGTETGRGASFRELEAVLHAEGEHHDVVARQRKGLARLDLLAVHEHAVPGEVRDGHLVLVGGLGAADVARDHRVLRAHCVWAIVSGQTKGVLLGEKGAKNKPGCVGWSR